MSRALDALVARHVMGWTTIGRLHEFPPERDRKRYIPEHTLHIGAAWRVVEAMRAKGWEDEHRNESAMTTWRFRRKSPQMGKPNIGRARGARHKGDAVLICLAALRAVGVPEDEIQAAMGGSDE